MSSSHRWREAGKSLAALKASQAAGKTSCGEVPAYETSVKAFAEAEREEVVKK